MKKSAIGGRQIKAGRPALNILFLCGIVSSVLYIGTDIASSIRYVGYSYADQAISELMAIGAPTRPFALSLMTVYNILVAVFAVGVIFSAGKRRALLIAGVVTLAYAINGQVCTAFFPMNMRGVDKTMSDEMHKLLTFVSVLFTLSSMGFAAAALGRKFRRYSIATMVLLAAFGIWAAGNAQRLEANLPTPWFGIEERINIYLTILWIAVFAANLMKVGSERRLGARK